MLRRAFPALAATVALTASTSALAEIIIERGPNGSLRLVDGARRAVDNDLDRLIRNAAADTCLPFPLLKALVAVESRFNPAARSHKGAMGLTQLMPQTARELGVQEPFDPQQNVSGGARYLRSLLDRFGRVDLALAAYNAGPTRVARLGRVPRIAETLRYVDRVTALARSYQSDEQRMGGAAISSTRCMRSRR